MWYSIIKVSPKPDTQLATEAAGAFVNCWIDFKEKEGAEHLAKFYLAQEGWNHEETQEVSWVEKEDYDDDSEGMQHFSEAETNSSVAQIRNRESSDRLALRHVQLPALLEDL